jgi:segregation and condensation protein B
VPVALPVADGIVGPEASAAVGDSVVAAAGIAPAATAAPSNVESPNAADGPRLAQGTERAAQSPPEELNVSPPQVIEAALFVGGGPLTARKFCALLRGSFDLAFVEQTIDELNTAYVAQARPYEIRLGEGGYRLELRPEYDRLRHRVYGSGPREVRLSQDVLEVLALVAYQQPVSQQEIESHGKQNAGNLLRQLLRRDLVAIARGAAGRKNVQYHTTARFLSVFGLGSLAELPQADDLAKK